MRCGPCLPHACRGLPPAVPSWRDRRSTRTADERHCSDGRRGVAPPGSAGQPRRRGPHRRHRWAGPAHGQRARVPELARVRAGVLRAGARAGRGRPQVHRVRQPHPDRARRLRRTARGLRRVALERPHPRAVVCRVAGGGHASRPPRTRPGRACRSGCPGGARGHHRPDRPAPDDRGRPLPGLHAPGLGVGIPRLPRIRTGWATAARRPPARGAARLGRLRRRLPGAPPRDGPSRGCTPTP